MRSISFRERFRYSLDNALSKGAIALTGWLMAVTIMLVLFVALIDYSLKLAPGSPSIVQLCYHVLLRTLDPGTISGDTGNWRYLATMLFVTLAGIVILSTLIGIINNAIMERIEWLRKGRSRVIEEDHTVILGWTKEIFTILEELVITNIHKKKPRVVVLAPRDKIQMEDEIRERVGKTRNTRIICRTGSPLEFQDLAIANLDAARSIIVLSPGQDSEVIKTLLAIVHSPHRRTEPYHIVAVMKDLANFEVARMVGRNEVQLLLEDDLISRIIAQTCRQSGLSVVYEEILDYAGDEFYFAHLPGLEGKTFEDVLFGLVDCSLLGLRRKQRLMLNPPVGTVLEAGDEIVCLAADQASIRYRDEGREKVNETHLVSSEPEETVPERTLILGVNHRTSMVINQLDRYVPEDSRVKVIASSGDFEESLRRECAELKHQKVEFTTGQVTDRRVLEALDLASYDRLVLMCDSTESPQQADSEVLISLLHLRDLGEKAGLRSTIVSEMSDPNNCRLAAVARADDFIVGSRLTSFLLTQISESRGLIEVFRELFDAEGQEIYLKPSALYVPLETPVTYATILEAARRKGEIAIGYRIAAQADSPEENFGVLLNPSKGDEIALLAEDRVVVVAGE